jgi:hypothetical protein
LFLVLRQFHFLTILELETIPFLEFRSEEEGVAAKIIATKSDLEEIAQSDEADVPALKGWRKEIFGKDAIKLKQGKIAITLNKKTKKLTFIRVK